MTGPDSPGATPRQAVSGKQPRGLFLLFGVEMWERFSYYGMRALLVLFLADSVAGFGFTDEQANGVYKWYTTAVYITPIFGGMLADAILGIHRSILIGSIVITAGHLCLALGSQTGFFVGLALVALGTGFFKSNISTMVGELYDQGDRRRDAGFTIFYMGINTGAFLGQIVCGELAGNERFGFHWAFGAAAVGMMLGLVMYVKGKRRFLGDLGTVPIKKRQAQQAATEKAPPLSREDWERISAIVILALFNIVFWAAFEQAGSSMNFFAERRIDRTIGSWEIRTAWFQSVNPLAIMLFAPLFAVLWTRLGARKREPSTPTKMAMGLYLLGIGFVFMVFGARASDGGALVSPMWLVMAYAFHTWGEICISPVGLSMVTKLAPAKIASLLMGVWFISSAAANFVAGSLAQLTNKIARGEVFTVLGGQADFFLIFVIASFIAGTLLLVISRGVRKLMHGHG
jgi:POT family proton-dependent oligopeptide transporter